MIYLYWFLQASSYCGDASPCVSHELMTEIWCNIQGCCLRLCGFLLLHIAAGNLDKLLLLGHN